MRKTLAVMSKRSPDEMKWNPGFPGFRCIQATSQLRHLQIPTVSKMICITFALHG